MICIGTLLSVFGLLVAYYIKNPSQINRIITVDGLYNSQVKPQFSGGAVPRSGQVPE